MNEIVIPNKYLPIGSIVLLHDASKRLMITGYCAAPNDDANKVYDYTGCLFPEGVVSERKTALFNHSDIQRVDHLGLSDEEQKEFITKLNQSINNSN